MTMSLHFGGVVAVVVVVFFFQFGLQNLSLISLCVYSIYMSWMFLFQSGINMVETTMTNSSSPQARIFLPLYYSTNRGPSIFLDKSGRLPDLSRKIEGPLLAGYRSTIPEEKMRDYS